MADNHHPHHPHPQTYTYQHQPQHNLQLHPHHPQPLSPTAMTPPGYHPHAGRKRLRSSTALMLAETPGTTTTALQNSHNNGHILQEDNAAAMEDERELTAAAAAGLAMVGEFYPHPPLHAPTTAHQGVPAAELPTWNHQHPQSHQHHLHHGQESPTNAATNSTKKKPGASRNKKAAAIHKRTDLTPALKGLYQKLHSTENQLECAAREKYEAERLLEEAQRRIANAYTTLSTLHQEQQELEKQVLDQELNLDNDFARHYQQLVHFQNQHGHCNCNQGELGQWVKKMRRMRNKYLKEKSAASKHNPIKYYIRALDRLNFVWDAVKDQWHAQFDKMLAFKRENGHCCVPKAYPPDKPLGAWVHRQRYFYKLYHEGKPNQLTPERIDLLNSVGFSWSGDSTTPLEESALPRPTKTRRGNHKMTAEEEWELNFQSLLEFKKQHGHVRVNAFDDKTRNNQLRDWCAWQRREYKRWKKNSSATGGGGDGQQQQHPVAITRKQIERLKSVGFQWDQFALGSSSNTSGNGNTTNSKEEEQQHEDDDDDDVDDDDANSNHKNMSNDEDTTTETIEKQQQQPLKCRTEGAAAEAATAEAPAAKAAAAATLLSPQT